MRVAVTSEYHFRGDSEGVFTDAAYPYEFWAALHEVFDEVVVIARVGDAPRSADHVRADGPGVRFAAVPDFVGARGLARHGAALAAIAFGAARAADVLILRTPGVIATAAHVAARALGRPYGVEVVGDARESLATAGPSTAAFSRIGSALQRLQVGGAVAASYVTARSLQALYPPPSGRLSVGGSDVELPDYVFAEAPIAITDDAVLDLVFVGPLARSYKGIDVLLAALAQTARPHRLTIVGDGALRASLTADAAARGLGDRVRFTGMVPAGPPVFALLRAADLFVLPSRTEGMPRALIEAMAMGLPCLATPVGGVPELLPADALVAVDDAGGLARAIDAVAAAPERRRAMAASNLARAHEFRASRRRARAVEFYRALAGEAQRR